MFTLRKLAELVQSPVPERRVRRSTSRSRRKRNYIFDGQQGEYSRDEIDQSCTRNFKPQQDTEGCGGTETHTLKHKKYTNIELIKDSQNGYGFSLRCQQEKISKGDKRKFVVSQVRPDTPAYSCAVLFAGDRVVSVNGECVCRLRLCDLRRLINAQHHLTLTVQYNLADDEDGHQREPPSSSSCSDRSAELVSVVEIGNERPPHGLGLLTNTTHDGRVFVRQITAASAAERSGRVGVGDRLVCVDGVCVDGMSCVEVERFLNNSQAATVRLAIVPCSAASSGQQLVGNDRSAIYSAAMEDELIFNESYSCICSDNQPFNGTCSDCVTEQRRTAHVQLTRDSPAAAVGIIVTNQPSGDDVIKCHVIVTDVLSDSVACRSGQVRLGDRLLSVNGRSVVGMQSSDVQLLLDQHSCPTLSITLEFNIPLRIFPTSGDFTIEVEACGDNIGLVVRSPSQSALSPLSRCLVVCDIVPGSSIDRTCAVEVGDLLVSVQGRQIEFLEISEILHLLETSAEVVTLGIRKQEVFHNVYGSSTGDYATNTDEWMSHAVFDVTLDASCRPLGLNISGSEDPESLTHVSSLKPGGEAERCGLLNVGDRLLAVDGCSVRQAPLSRVIELLMRRRHQAVVCLTLSRPNVPCLSWMTESDKLARPDNMLQRSHSHHYCCTRQYSDDISPGSSQISSCTRTPVTSNTSVEDMHLSVSSPRHTATGVHNDLDLTYSGHGQQRRVVLYKHEFYEDFGFSVSSLEDGSVGVYVNSVKPAGAADKPLGLKPFDKILQVNGSDTSQLDCCHVVPLIAAAGHKLDLLVARDAVA